jgi:hypothetical protein
VHNLVAGSVTMQSIPNRFTPYHVPHSTQVMGLMTLLGGDDRWLNNLFLAPQDRGEALRVEDENADLGRDAAADIPFGLACCDAWPAPDEPWVPHGSVNAYAEAKLPVHIGANVFTAGTRPGRHGEALSVALRPRWRLELEEGRCRVILEEPDRLPRLPTLAPGCLGSAFQSECPFEDPDAIPVDWRRDTTGDLRRADTTPGPAAELAACAWPAFSVPAAEE